MALAFLASCGGGAQQTSQQAGEGQTETAPSATTNDIVDETTIMDIYNMIPDKKEGFKEFVKIHAQCFNLSIMIRLNEGVPGYAVESLNFYKYNDGGWLLVFDDSVYEYDNFLKLYDYKDGKLTPSKMKLPTKSAKDLVTDYLYFLGAEDQVADEKLTAFPYGQDTLACYYNPNYGYEFPHSYAYGTLYFVWDGEKFVEQALIPKASNYVNSKGLRSYWTVEGVDIGGTRPKAIKGYTIKEEKGAFVYYLNGDKRFSVYEGDSGIEKICVFTKYLGYYIGHDRKVLEGLSYDGCVATKLCYNNNLIEYVFDKPDGEIVQINIVKGDNSVDPETMMDFYVQVLNAGGYSDFVNDPKEMDVQEGEGNCFHESRMGAGFTENFHFVCYKRGKDLFGAIDCGANKVDVWKYENGKATELKDVMLDGSDLCYVFKVNADVLNKSEISYHLTCGGQLVVGLVMADGEGPEAMFDFDGRRWSREEE